MSGRRFLAQTWYLLVWVGFIFCTLWIDNLCEGKLKVDGNITRFTAIWSTKTITDIFWLITFIIMSVTSQNVRLDARMWRDHWRYWSHDDPKWWDNKNCHLSEPSAIQPHRKENQIPSLLLFTVRLSNFIKAKRSRFSYLYWFSKQ